MPPSAGPASRPWSRSARASANASGASATAWPVGCGCVTTTGRTTWPTIFQQEVAFFGIESSPSFVREPEGNGVAERFIRTLKENVLWVRSFDDDRGAPPGLARVQADIQRTVDAGEIRLSKPRPGATRPRRAGRGSVEANTVKPLSKNPGAATLAACQKGYRVRFTTAAALVNELLEARDDKRLLRFQKQLAKQDLLIVDELGYVPLSKTGAELLFEIFSQRYEQASTLVTSNLPFNEWTEIFGSERLTGALLDRLTHHVHILELNGESYRLEHSKKARQPAATPAS